MFIAFANRRILVGKNTLHRVLVWYGGILAHESLLGGTGEIHVALTVEAHLATDDKSSQAGLASVKGVHACNDSFRILDNFYGIDACREYKIFRL